MLCMDNFFLAVQLFCDLQGMGTFCTGTIRANRVGLPNYLTCKANFKHGKHGDLHWSMHESRKMAFIVWYNKKPMMYCRQALFRAWLNCHSEPFCGYATH